MMLHAKFQSGQLKTGNLLSNFSLFYCDIDIDLADPKYSPKLWFQTRCYIPSFMTIGKSKVKLLN